MGHRWLCSFDAGSGAWGVCLFVGIYKKAVFFFFFEKEDNLVSFLKKSGSAPFFHLRNFPNEFS